MTNSSLTVVARFKAKAGKEGDFREELLELLSPTRSEDGCIRMPSILAFRRVQLEVRRFRAVVEKVGPSQLPLGYLR